MKIRPGFVSNSSTTSFLIYGACLDGHEFKYDEDKFDDLYEYLDSLDFKNTHLSIEHGFESHYIGICPTEIGDDETGAQFKARVEAAIKKVLPDYTGKFEYYEEAFHDG
jgi:hypothetical protein